MPAPKILTKQQILKAYNAGGTHKQAARLLGVFPSTYKTYAKLFIDEETGLNFWESKKNLGGKGLKRFNYSKGQYDDIYALLEGNNINTAVLDVDRFKESLIRNAIIEEKCNKCGFHERRIFDKKVPVLLNFLDGNKLNWLRENIEFLCYNCYFLHVGNIFNNKQIQSIESEPFNEEGNPEIWEIDDTMKEHLKSLNLWDEEDTLEDNDFIVFNK